MNRSELRRAKVPLSLLILLFLFVYACVPEPITNLRLVEVSRMPATALPPSDDLREILTERHEAIWRVSLSGDSSWIGEVNQHDLNSYANVVRCDNRDQSLLSVGPYVGPILVTDYAEGFGDEPAKSGIVRYDIYLPETWRYTSNRDFNAPMPSYDLSTERIALCIVIAGGAMHGAYNRSNEVRVEVGRMP